MRITKKTQVLLVIRHYSSIMLALLGSCMLFFGLYIIYGTLTGGGETNLMILLLICGLFVCFGLYLIYLGFEYISIEMNKETGAGIYVRKGLFNSERMKFDLSEINSVYASEYRCLGDCTPSSAVVISTRNREFKLFSPVIWSFKYNRQIADEVSDFLDIPRSDVEYYAG
jgi:hypothetical protein